MAGQVAKFRAILLQLITLDDWTVICRKLIDGARAGKLEFIRELLDRTIGRPDARILMDVQQQTLLTSAQLLYCYLRLGTPKHLWLPEVVAAAENGLQPEPPPDVLAGDQSPIAQRFGAALAKAADDGDANPRSPAAKTSRQTR